MTFAELLAVVVERLDAAGIPYMVTGSLASSYYGEPRSTRDVDIVIDPDPAALDRLVADLASADFHVDLDAARAALASRSQFNAIGPAADKVDFLIRRDRRLSSDQRSAGRRKRSSSRRRRLFGRPSPRTARMPGRTSDTTGGGL